MNVHLSHGERLAVLSSLRREHSHAARSRHNLAMKYGPDTDFSRSDEWIAWLTSAFVKVGGDLATLRREDARV